MSTQPSVAAPRRPVEQVETVTIRFVGDSGDGMQLTGAEFTRAAALAGNDLATFPDYPAEIRARPRRGCQATDQLFVQDIHTPNVKPDVLVAMNPAALRRTSRPAGRCSSELGRVTASIWRRPATPRAARSGA
jgi:2-oxoglutarate ferredoxin oxidoreductase subunit alpha